MLNAMSGGGILVSIYRGFVGVESDRTETNFWSERLVQELKSGVAKVPYFVSRSEKSSKAKEEE